MANYSNDKRENKGSNNRGKGANFPKRGRNNKRSNDMDRDARFSEHNDFSWYNKNPHLVSTAANLSYGNALGYPIAGARSSGIIPDTFPGIMALSVLPGPGVGDTDISACNLAADNLYAYIRQANSGGKNYDPNDLMSYLLAFDELYMMYYAGVRAYGAINLYNAQNRYAPSALLTAMGWSYDDIVSNLSRFKYAIQAFATRMNSFYVPGAWPYYKRHAWLYSNLFTDSTSPKAQLYLIKPAAYRVRDDATGALKPGEWCTKVEYPDVTEVSLDSLTVDKWISIMHELLEALTNSEDIGTIGGDIRKAFPTEQLIKFTDIPDTYTIMPIYDESVLSQFENATIFQGVANIDITMDNEINRGNVVYEPWIKYDGRTIFNRLLDETHVMRIDNFKEVVPSTQSRLINIHKDNPSVEDTVIATRLATFADPSTDLWKLYRNNTSVTHVTFEPGDNPENMVMFMPVVSCGAEVVAKAEIFSFNANGGLIIADVLPMIELAHGTSPTVATVAIACFKHHPITYHIASDPSSTDMYVYGTTPFTQIDTYGTLTLDSCTNIHESCMLSLFNVPIF